MMLWPSDTDGEHVVDMDEVADAVGKEIPKTKFYYAEETQQNKFKCSACGEHNDILGRYGYCSSCGTYNGVSELETDINQIRERIRTTIEYEACVKDAVSAFDSFARQITKQLVSRIPMTPPRRKEWEKKLFHNLRPSTDGLSAAFDIHTLKSLSAEEISFASLMFHRRHVYEHNGGEVDAKYIQDSGDTSVRPKQVIRETIDTASRITDLVLRMAHNVGKGFHQIFPPEEFPINLYSQQTQHQRK